ncbi:DUF4396 domain-containing protein [Pelagivirga sediminicola]|uniref:DUF4396 domain-containing protein n=1 Tax=Pelagivirga sediminicola TaxID=2170575 RepID=UPI002434342C|nr:DUF4396 domain-containing protein [Pelagivirga sediminicola]
MLGFSITFSHLRSAWLFQYSAIVRMRRLGMRKGSRVAIKADALSLSARQIGMYGLMAIAHFGMLHCR